MQNNSGVQFSNRKYNIKVINSLKERIFMSEALTESEFGKGHFSAVASNLA